MAEKEEFRRLLGHRRAAAVLLATFGLTLLKDLTFGIVAGCLLAATFAIVDRWSAKTSAVSGESTAD
jgi:SulP family sulfate permease